MSQLLVLLAIGGAIFAFILFRQRGVPAGNAATQRAIAALASINLAGAFGMTWFAANILRYDGLMPWELSICAFLAIFLVAATVGAFALRRRQSILSAVALLATAAVPTVAVWAFLLYLDANPIDMR